MQKTKVQRGGNTAELERLEKELADEKVTRQRNWELKAKAEEETRLKNKELFDVKASLKEAYEKIRRLESDSKVGEVMKTGYVEIASCPFGEGKYPLPAKVDGVIVPRRKDEDGVIYEMLPVKNALAMLTDGSAFKRYLVGPDEVYKIEGTATKGLYKVPVTFNKHRKVKNKDGYTFVKVEIEEPKE